MILEELHLTEKDKVQGKVEITIGNLSFIAEGSQDWLGEQLAKVIGAAMALPAAAQAKGGTPSQPEPKTTGTPTTTGDSLASYLRAKGGDSKQVVRFLATAAWLVRRGITEVTTGTVARALTDNHQKKLANPSDCLNKNVTKGFCEKIRDNAFFITSEGWASLGETQ
jgi:hypothetical protein